MPYPKGAKVGDILVADGVVRNNVFDSFQDGTEFRVDRLDRDEDCISLEVPGDYGNGGYWFYFDQLCAECGYPDNKFTIKNDLT